LWRFLAKIQSKLVQNSPFGPVLIEFSSCGLFGVKRSTVRYPGRISELLEYCSLPVPTACSLSIHCIHAYLFTAYSIHGRFHSLPVYSPLGPAGDSFYARREALNESSQGVDADSVHMVRSDVRYCCADHEGVEKQIMIMHPPLILHSYIHLHPPFILHSSTIHPPLNMYPLGEAICGWKRVSWSSKVMVVSLT
jgi:hypothetical protein